MSWKLASFLALACWGTYGIFAAEAGKLHGEKMNMFFAALSYILVGGLVVFGGGTGDFAKLTARSAGLGMAAGLLSALGVYFLLSALGTAPAQIPFILMIAGMFPVVTVVVSAVIKYGNPLLPRQWVGVALAAAGIALVNWSK